MSSNKKVKKQALAKLKPNQYKVYGIFNFKTEKLIFLSLESDLVMEEFDLEGYDNDHDIIEFDVILS